MGNCDLGQDEATCGIGHSTHSELRIRLHSDNQLYCTLKPLVDSTLDCGFVDDFDRRIEIPVVPSVNQTRTSVNVCCVYRVIVIPDNTASRHQVNV